MLPKTLALVDDDRDYTEFLSQDLTGRGIAVEVFSDSDELLTAVAPFEFDFYVLDLMLPGIDGLSLIKLLRRRTDAGILVVSGRLAPETFEQVVHAGADMYLAKPIQFEQVALAVLAVQRRAGRGGQTETPWKLDRRQRSLIAPDGAVIDLSDSDLAVMQCFAEAGGDVVSRDILRQRLGHETPQDDAGGLNATIYRLRRRIERATPILVPLQSKSRVGYLFKAPLATV